MAKKCSILNGKFVEFYIVKKMNEKYSYLFVKRILEMEIFKLLIKMIKKWVIEMEKGNAADAR